LIFALAISMETDVDCQAIPNSPRVATIIQKLNDIQKNLGMFDGVI
jgi:hypothetical protein